MSSPSDLDNDLSLLKQLRANRETHQKFVAPPTEKRQIGVKSAWNCFLKEKEALFCQPGFTLDVDVYKIFFRWYTKNSKGLFSPHPTLSSMLANVGIFCSLLNLEKSVREDIKGYVAREINNELGLSNVCRPKRLFTIGDMEILLDYLFCKDRHEYPHLRYRVQIAFGLQIGVYSAARPGAIHVSSGYRGSNEALLYKDFKLQLVKPAKDNPILDRTPRFNLTITFRLMKGNRHSPGEDIDLTLKENRECPLKCPITMFIALAFGDKAFEHFSSPNDLLSYTLQPDRVKLDVKIKPELLLQPIFRTAEKRQISPYRAWTCECSALNTARLSVRAGFRYKFRPYDARRGSSNVINVIATEAQQNRLLGHKSSKVFTANYLSRHVRLDTQGYIDKGCGEEGHINQLTSQAIERRDNAPPRLPPEILKEIKNDRELERLLCAKVEAWRRLRDADLGILCWDNVRKTTKQLVLIETIKTSIDVDKQEQAVKLINDAYNAYRTHNNYYRKLVEQRHAIYRAEWFEDANTMDALNRPATATTSTQTASASTPPSALEKLFYPEYELKSLSLELIEALALDCDPQEYPRAKSLSQKKRQAGGDETAPQTTLRMLSTSVQRGVKRKHSVMSKDPEDFEHALQTANQRFPRGNSGYVNRAQSRLVDLGDSQENPVLIDNGELDNTDPEVISTSSKADGAGQRVDLCPSPTTYSSLGDDLGGADGFEDHHIKEILR